MVVINNVVSSLTPRASPCASHNVQEVQPRPPTLVPRGEFMWLELLPFAHNYVLTLVLRLHLRTSVRIIDVFAI